MHPHRPRKRFGQNFLTDPFVIDQIIASINPQPNDLMVEIGPGLAALTNPLLTTLKRLYVIELDRDLVAKLQSLALVEKLIIYSADVLRFDFLSIKKNNNKLRVVGNLPYNISTPLIFHLLETVEHIEDMHIMLQKEVADRIAAPCGSKHYGRLSVMVQYYCDIEKCFDILPIAFSPPPKVTSSFVSLTPRKPTLVANNKTHLEKIVRLSFQQRRKTLQNNLKGMVSAEALLQLGINPKLRPENIAVDEYVHISNLISNGVPNQP